MPGAETRCYHWEIAREEQQKYTKFVEPAISATDFGDASEKRGRGKGIIEGLRKKKKITTDPGAGTVSGTIKKIMSSTAAIQVYRHPSIDGR